MLTLEQARLESEKALAAIADLDFNDQEINSLDRFCPDCWLVQPDDDSIYCFDCGADLGLADGGKVTA
jgi:hypothetical protein